ncbi:MAG TPA: AraC family transcriptional regulator [Flavisolibacter sp.]|nr:AraC family transcriptional regulator [Flavisolibacter sp.]
MQLLIKNMVCDRCIMVVRQQLDDAGIGYKQVQLGEVELAQQISSQQLDALKTRLSNLGFEVLDDRKSAIINKVKSSIIRIIHTNEAADMNMKLSVLLSEKLDMDYHYLSALFSSIEGITIEKYVILQRIERAKELLMYDEMTINEIADALGYSSVQHLSQQFKKITGLTPTHFKNLKDKKRKSLDEVGTEPAQAKLE